ncbi:2-hydroxyacid dehydrogenase [Acuticoccus sp. I52.16.1]|uniref:2-hydroxyacid dehydrogenase n=1 Tax=Acuticoccus sp. I52.16.1 TaxID=2928472 RepID=UPI001FD35EB3|nr:2-hydroxyacid dehydrogenase [Acuticoccus sp. I52.16.1]UOM32875.1 2-hydroxyacid dehydrogenase [Acuticoccus sp. I52.16.1]
MKPDILILSPMQPSVHEALRDGFIVHTLHDAPDKAALLAKVGPTVRGAIANGGHGVDIAVLDALPKLEMISSFGVGYDGLDIEYCKARGIKVTYTPNVLNDAMAEITLGLMIAMARQLPQADRYTRENKWETNGPFGLTAELTGKTVGIAGLGRVGKEIALRAQAFKMQVVYFGRTKQDFVPYPHYSDLKQMARDVDWLVNVMPGGAATAKMFDAEIFDALGPEGYFVNVGRGATADEAALIEALKAKRIAGAALDVFEKEPGVPAGLRELDNVVLSPHQGSATEKTRWMMGDLVTRNLKAWFDGKPVLTPLT